MFKWKKVALAAALALAMGGLTSSVGFAKSKEKPPDTGNDGLTFDNAPGGAKANGSMSIEFSDLQITGQGFAKVALRLRRGNTVDTFFASGPVSNVESASVVQDEITPLLADAVIGSFFPVDDGMGGTMPDPTLALRLKETPEFGQVQVCPGGTPTPVLEDCNQDFPEQIALLVVDVTVVIVDARCSDAKDNDGDGLVDFGEDPECADESDDNEAS